MLGLLGLNTPPDVKTEGSMREMSLEIEVLGEEKDVRGLSLEVLVLGVA